MVGFPSHFAIGLILSFPFVIADKKNRYRTLIVGGIAAVAPDLDAPAMIWDLSILGLEHRGVLHWFTTWFIVTGIAFIVYLAVLYDKYKRPTTEKITEFAYDKGLYVCAVSIGWLSHLLVDFSFTDFNGDIGWIYSMSLKKIWYIDNILGFLTVIILGGIIIFEIREHKKTVETVLDHQKGFDVQDPQKQLLPLQSIVHPYKLQTQQVRLPIGEFGNDFGIDNIEEVTRLLIDHEKELQSAKKKLKFHFDEKSGILTFKSRLEIWTGRIVNDIPSVLLAIGFILILEIILSLLLFLLIWGTIFIL